MNGPCHRLALLVLLVAVAPATAQKSDLERTLADRLQDLARRLESTEPDRHDPATIRPDAPLFRFAQLADIHWTPARTPLLAAAMAYLDDEVGPDFVVLTGDNTSDRSLEGHRRLRALLEDGLSMPWYALRGDNDARHFAAVFGSTRWSFDWGGLHVVGCGLDRDVEDLGIGTFAPDTWRWLRQDLARSAERPTVYFQHEPCVPPSFLDAPRLATTLSASPNVVLVVSGHLHHDLEFRFLGKPHRSVVALGPSDHHGLTVYDVHADGIVARSHHSDGPSFRPTRIATWVPFPRRLRLDPTAPRRRTDPDVLPARPTEFDDDLTRRVEGLRRILRRFDR